MLPKPDLKDWWAQIEKWRERKSFRFNQGDKVIKPQYALERLNFYAKLQEKEFFVTTDVGQHQMWAAQRYRSSSPRGFITSGGLGAMGFALPAAVGVQLAQPDTCVLCVSGDGGFLFSAAELETAVRLKQNLVHMVWIDGTYDMVAVQEKQKYGRPSGIEFGPVDVVKYAEAFGVKGMMIGSAEEITPVLRRALEYRNGPVLIGVHVDYSDNHKLFEMVHADSFH